MSLFATIVEKKIKESMKNGDFDDLPGKGKPIDLDDYFKTPARLRMAYQLLKNYGLSPEEVELKKEIAELKNRLSKTKSTKDQGYLQKKINYKTLLLDLSLEKNKKYYRF